MRKPRVLQFMGSQRVRNDWATELNSWIFQKQPHMPSSGYFFWFPIPWESWWASLVTQGVKNLPAMQETQVWLLGQEYPLEEEMGTHSSILAWRIPWIKEPGRLQSMGSQRIRHDWKTNTLRELVPPLGFLADVIEPSSWQSCGGICWEWCWISLSHLYALRNLTHFPNSLVKYLLIGSILT